MAAFFASPKLPSLFPMAISRPVISKEDYHLFYKFERILFALLIVPLRRKVPQSMLVMGFLLWLEREGYTSQNLVKLLVDSSYSELINRTFDEVILFLNFLQKGSIDFHFNDMPMLQCLFDRKSIKLADFYLNRNAIFNEVFDTAKDLSENAFDDILERYLSLRQPANANLGGISRRRAPPPAEVPEPPEDRTIFLTFSKGYPISEYELRYYFTRLFGDFIESVVMEAVTPPDQPLYAKMVARSSSIISAVIERDGAVGKTKYYINGKHVWARKFVPYRQIQPCNLRS